MKPMVVAVMGVSGSGKTTVARALAERLGWKFQEGDDLHPAANVAKMASGHPLDDEDRWPWLRLVAGWVDARLAAGEPGIITCSLLKKSYRDVVIGDRPGVRLMYLHGEHAVIAAHIAARHGHFMPPGLLDSQFAALEEPSVGERALMVEVTDSIVETVTAAVTAMEMDS